MIGDGGLFYQVADIAVEPAHQRRGLGKAIVGKVVEHLKQQLRPALSSASSLMATPASLRAIWL